MRILCTFPGRSGDLLWSLPSIRAISEAHGVPVDLILAVEYAALVPLLRLQPYLGIVYTHPDWIVQQTAPMSPRTPPGNAGGYDHVYHLGYKSWPPAPLPYYIAQLAGVEIDLTRPWITVPAKAGRARRVCCGWSDEHFELKVGLTALTKRQGRTETSAYTMAEQWHVIVPPHSRWASEWAADTGPSRQAGEDWLTAAQWITHARVFLGCCSALHVLACALGKPCVIMEPAEARWNDIFWPYGKNGPQVTLVTGHDGQPTFDARHVGDALAKALHHGQ